MIYTFGCSLTKWFWPTWSDWLQKYSNEEVLNLGWPGSGNEVYYWELLERKDQIKTDDTVIIMLTGNNRIHTWYDEEWIQKNDCKGFFPRKDGHLGFSQNKWQGLYKLHPEHDCSLTNMLISNFDNILKMQLLLTEIGCNFKFVFWQNPWLDIRPEVEDGWQPIWMDKKLISETELQTAEEILKIKPVQSLINSIDWSKFIQPPSNPLGPSTYNGFWEYRLNKLENRDYIKYVHNDPHPDALMQHDFLVEIILNKDLETSEHRELAKQTALTCLDDMPDFDYDFLITDNFAQQIKFISGIKI